MLKIVELEGKWELVEEVNKLILLKRVPCMGYDIIALRKLTEVEKHPRRQLRAGIQAVTYLMVDSSGIGFGSVLWGQGGLVTGSGVFPPLYSVRLSTIWEGVNLNTRIEKSVARGERQDVEMFGFSKNLVFERVYYKGALKSPLLFLIVLHLNQV